MKRFVVAVAAAASSALFVFSSLASASTLKSLNQTQVNDQIKGKTITTISLITLDGSLANNTFTGYFDSNGQLEGRLANKPDNNPQTDKGKWTVKSDGSLCTTWDNWNKSQTSCMSVYKVKNGLVLINEKNHMLETIILEENIKKGNQVG